MAQNEMKAKPAPLERVRSMEGLGVGCGGVPLTLPKSRPETAQAATEGCVFIALDSARQVCSAVARAACICSCQPLRLVSSSPAKRDERPAHSGAGKQRFETNGWSLKRVRGDRVVFRFGQRGGPAKQTEPFAEAHRPESAGLALRLAREVRLGECDA